MAANLSLGSPEGHGASVDALLDSMIWGGMNDLDPPYTIRIANASKAKPKVRQELSDLSICIDEAKEEYRCRKGNNIEVFFEVMP
jgi:RNAse (barnase) inhibitor barstar